MRTGTPSGSASTGTTELMGRKRRKKINVPPGYSITASDLFDGKYVGVGKMFFLVAILPFFFKLLYEKKINKIRLVPT